jgi:putative transposase
VRTIKESSLEQLILFGERSVRRAAAEFIVHYHGEHNHQGLDKQLISPDRTLAREGAEVKRLERLGDC